MTMMGVLRSPRMTLFGSGQRGALTEIIRGFGNRAFICADERFLSDAKLGTLALHIREAGLTAELYAEALPELPISCIEAATSRAKEFAPDVIVGIGGGSCLDLAKLVSVGVSHDAPLSTFYGEFKVPGPTLPVIAIPTTAGTGSETTPVAVVADPQRDMKVGISSPHLIPDVAICDPELTLTCPPRLTAITGADALTHALEAFTALRRKPSPQMALEHVFIGKNTFSDAQATLAIRLLARHLPAAVENGGDITAREMVMMGAFSAGQAFGVAGTAAAHAIQYPVGALTHTAHGLGVAALMPYVLEYNLRCCIAELAEIGRLFGLRHGGSEEALAIQAIDAVAELFRRIGIPPSLAQLGLPSEKKAWVAEQSLSAARLVKNNPRPLDRAAMEKIVEAAFVGDRSLLRQ